MPQAEHAGQGVRLSGECVSALCEGLASQLAWAPQQLEVPDAGVGDQKNVCAEVLAAETDRRRASAVVSKRLSLTAQPSSRRGSVDSVNTRMSVEEMGGGGRRESVISVLADMFGGKRGGASKEAIESGRTTILDV